VAELFSSGRAVDAILMFMVFELIVLIIVRKKAARGLQPVPLMVSLAAGAALLLSLRAALVGQSWRTIAAWLILALIAHLLDLTLRWSVS
jgi:hypothetical protein